MINEQTLSLIQTSWQKMVPRREDIIQRFFRRLFETSPELEPLFSKDLHTQSRQFAGMLNLIINGIDQMDTIAPSLDTLGKTHRSYGITREQIKVMEDVLIDTFSQELGNAFTPELEMAWRESYNAITANMAK